MMYFKISSKIIIFEKHCIKIFIEKTLETNLIFTKKLDALVGYSNSSALHGFNLSKKKELSTGTK